MQLDALVAQVEARKDILALKIPYELLPVEVKALLQTAATELAASEGVTKVPLLLGGLFVACGFLARGGGGGLMATCVEPRRVRVLVACF